MWRRRRMLGGRGWGLGSTRRLRGLRGRRSPFMYLITAVAALILILVVLERSLEPVILYLAETEARWQATEAINRAIMEEVAQGVQYRDLVSSVQDDQQRVVYLEANILVINRLIAQTTLRTQAMLQELKDRGVSIPLGAVLGSKFLANRGPKLGLSLWPVGTVSVALEDTFEAAGINQTRHRIYLKVNSTVKVVVPFTSSNVEVSSLVPVVDAIIVGPVPQTYLSFSSNGLSLVPGQVAVGTNTLRQ